MNAVINSLFNFPQHRLLIASGLFFLLLTIGSQIGGLVHVSAAIGAYLLAQQRPEDSLLDYLRQISSKQFSAAQELNLLKLNIEAAFR